MKTERLQAILNDGNLTQSQVVQAVVSYQNYANYLKFAETRRLRASIPKYCEQ